MCARIITTTRRYAIDKDDESYADILLGVIMYFQNTKLVHVRKQKKKKPFQEF